MLGILLALLFVYIGGWLIASLVYTFWLGAFSEAAFIAALYWPVDLLDVLCGPH